MGHEKLEAIQEKAKEKFEEKAKQKKEDEQKVLSGEKPKEKPKKKVEVKKPVVSQIAGRGVYLPISSKTSVEVCRAISGQKVDVAKRILNDAIALKKPIRYYRYKRDTPHKKGKGFGAGRYAVKVSKHILGVLENAIANAAYLNLNPEKLYVKEAITNRTVSKERGGRHSEIKIIVAEKKEDVVKKSKTKKETNNKKETKVKK